MDLKQVQRRRKQTIIAGLILLAGVLPFVSSLALPESLPREAIEVVGVALIVLCILGRTWTSLYIGGRKKSELVTTGPFSVVRNPLYVFSLIGVAGFGMCSGSAAVGLLAAAAGLLIFHRVVLSEEAFLADAFPGAYADYMRRVNRWLPHFSGWQDVEETVVRPHLVLVTFRDACYFLIAIPLFELLDYFQSIGTLPVLIRLP